MWTEQNRKRYDRSQLRYPSDLTDDEWTHVEPLIPPARRGGNKRHVDVHATAKRVLDHMAEAADPIAALAGMPTPPRSGDDWKSFVETLGNVRYSEWPVDRSVHAFGTNRISNGSMRIPRRGGRTCSSSSRSPPGIPRASVS